MGCTLLHKEGVPIEMERETAERGCLDVQGSFESIQGFIVEIYRFLGRGEIRVHV
jgi:hypothetical protein